MLRPARSRLTAPTVSASSISASLSRGRITSTAAAAIARRMNRPRRVLCGNSRTPLASIRGSSSNCRSTASWQSASSSASLSSVSRSDTHSLVCLACSTSWIPTPNVARIRCGLERPRDDLLAAAEQGVGVQVHGPGCQLDVAGVGEAGADHRPHREQPLQDQRPMIGQRLVDGLEPAALGDGAGELAGDISPALARSGRGGFHPATARG